MKKTLTINLSGSVWTINDDAYQSLKNYLDELENSFSSDDEREILNDVEARISELFAERLGKRAVVEMTDVEYVISVLGNVSDFSETEEKSEEQAKETDESDRKRLRRYYRNPDDKIFGGVASGLAAYLGFGDVLLMRILFVLFFFFGYSFPLIIYIILWLVVPEAKTLAQKLEMKGEQVTIDSIKNIKTKITESMPDEKTVQTTGQRIVEVLLRIVKWCLIIFGSFIGISILTICIAVVFGIIVFGGVVILMPELMTDFITLPYFLLFTSIFLLGLLPLIGGIWFLARLLKRKPSEKNRAWLGWSMFALWIVTFFMLIFSAIKVGYSSNHIGNWSNYINVSDWDSSDSDVMISEPRQLTDFNAIHAERAAKVILSQSETYAVRVFAPADCITKVTTEVKDGVLYVYNNSSRNARVEVSMPAIKRISLGGASRVKSESYITAQDFDLQLTGASRADLKMNVKNLVVDATSASKVDVDGSAKNLLLHASGASKAALDELKAQIADVTIQGASKAIVFVLDTLKIDVSGASKLKYKGHPVIPNTQTDMSSVVRYDNE